MEVKIDTKEKFTVVTPVLSHLSANIAAELADTCTIQLQKPVKNLVLNLQSVLTIEEKAAETLTRLQQSFYENSASFVICSLQPSVEEGLDKLELLEMLNITPTESEAWDIVQMEEIERELLDGDDMEFDKHV
jgi:anti-anti-sigma regulatory factor